LFVSITLMMVAIVSLDMNELRLLSFKYYRYSSPFNWIAAIMMQGIDTTIEMISKYQIICFLSR
jgi:hypothetical protein